MIPSQTRLWAAPLFLLLLFANHSRSHAQQDSSAPGASSTVSTGFGPVTIKGTRVAEIDSSHARIAVDLAASANRNVTIENLRLTGLRLNGLPVYAEPLSQPIELVHGKETALPPIYVTIQTRDLTSVAPLRAMIENQSVRVQGQVVAALKMNFLDKLALHTEHPRVSFPVAQDVPVAFGSTPLARQAALGVLTVIEFGMQGTAAARKNLPGLESAWVHDLEEQANANLVQVESRYVLKQHDTRYPVILDQFGFRLTSGRIITTAEAKTPWAYDPEFLTKIKSGEAKLEKKETEVQLRSTARAAAGDTPLLLTHKDFTIEERGSAEKDPLIIQKGQKDQQDEQADFGKIELRRRASPNSLVVITLAAPPAAGGYTAAPAAIAGQDGWERVAIYRLIPDGSSGKPTIEVVQLSARRDGQGIHLSEPVDSSFYGSPIMVPEGVLGIVQDEQAGAFLPADLQ